MTKRFSFEKFWLDITVGCWFTFTFRRYGGAGWAIFFGPFDLVVWYKS